MFTLKKRKLRGELIMVNSFLKVSREGRGANLLSLVTTRYDPRKRE